MSYSKKYCTQNLKKAFVRLKGVQKETLAPMLDVIYQKWMSAEKKSVERVEHFRIERSFSTAHVLTIIDKKQREIYVHVEYEDVNSKENDKHLYKTKSIIFESDCKDAGKKIRKHFKNFVKTQNKLEDLLIDAANELDKDSRDDLDEEIKRFYFGNDTLK